MRGMTSRAALLVAAIAALAAIVAPAASGEAVEGHFTFDEAATLTGDEIGPDHFFSTGSGLQWTCTSTHWDGVGTQPASSNTATFDPFYSGCSVKVSIFTFPMTIDTTSCDYTLHGTESDLEIDCEPGDTIDIRIYQNHTNHTAGTTLCTLTIGEQTIDGGVTFTNTAGSPDDFDLILSGAQFNMTRTGSSFCGAVNQVASNTGSLTMTAFNESDERIGGEVG